MIVIGFAAARRLRASRARQAGSWPDTRQPAARRRFCARGQRRTTFGALVDGRTYCVNQLAEHARSDNLVGSTHVIETAATQLRQIEQLVDRGSPELTHLATCSANGTSWGSFPVPP